MKLVMVYNPNNPDNPDNPNNPDIPDNPNKVPGVCLVKPIVSYTSSARKA